MDLSLLTPLSGAAPPDFFPLGYTGLPAAGSSTPAVMSSAEAAKRAAIDATAKAFEGSFLSTMIGEMFEGAQTEAPFGGGQGEQAFRSFLTDAIGQAVTRRGGVGLSKAVAREMLKLQGLS